MQTADVQRTFGATSVRKDAALSTIRPVIQRCDHVSVGRNRCQYDEAVGLTKPRTVL